jgi:hypothetical protein
VARIPLMGEAVCPSEGFVKYAEVNVANLEIALFMDYNKHNNRKKSGAKFKVAFFKLLLLARTKIRN